MSSKAIVCAACSAAVPYGRLSCPSCGELLASVVGAPRRAVATVAAGAAVATKRSTRSTRATPAVLVDVSPPAAAVAAIVEAPVAPSLERGPAFTEPEPPLAETAGGDPSVGEPGPGGSQPAAAAPLPAAPAPDWPADGPAWPDEPPRWRDERTAVPAVVAASVTSPSLANAPGAYVPPVVPATPAGPPAPARAWAGHPGDGEATGGATATATSAGLVDPARLTEFIGWLAVAGSAIAAVGFVLPWGISVIGASGVDYFDRWGMAGPFHPIVVLGVLAVLGLSLVPNPVPMWARVGLPGLGLGALLFGLVWPYLLYLPGTGPGVAVVAIGSVILIVAGIAALVADRHAPEPRAV